VARSAWTGSRLSAIELLLASESPGDLLNRAGILDAIARYNDGVLTGAATADAEARRARAAAEAAAIEAAALVSRVTSQQDRLDRQVAAYKTDYERLLHEEQAAREAAERAARERAAQEQAARDQAAAERASRDHRPSTSTTTSPPAPPVSAPAPAPAPAPVSTGGGGSAAARTAVNTALAQVGKPYRWGAAGPDAFDCSGLTMYAYRAAGISLPHSSRMQSTMGTAVSRSAMQPGDLLFYYSPVSHVSMYIGNGQMVHASTYGEPVKVVPVSSMPGFHTVRRIA
jgi:cell wall-associated NlpC family hydrolase